MDKGVPDLKDVQVVKALEALMEYYRSLMVEIPELPERERMIFDRVTAILQLREQPLEQTKDENSQQPTRRRFSRGLRQNSQEEIYLACLRKIHKSTKQWSKNYGERGYLYFISNYV